MNPIDLRYHKEHSWVKPEGNRVVMGITDFAQGELGDIVYIDLSETDAELEANGEFSEIESTKRTYSIISPVTGTIVKVNEDLADTPELINEDPYEKGWIAVIELTNPSELDSMMDSDEYEKFLASKGK